MIKTQSLTIEITEYTFERDLLRSNTIDIILKIDCLMAHTACLVCLVNTVSGHRKTHSEKPALVAGKKLSKQANKADGLTRQSG